MTAQLQKAFWLLPAIYVAHNTEEYIYIGRFAEKHNIRSLLAESPNAIIYAAIFGLAAMCVCFVYRRRPSSDFWLLTIIGALFLNGVTHTLQAIYYLDYVPGFGTSLGFYLPVCGYLLISSFRSGILKIRQIPILAIACLLITAVILGLSFGIAVIA
jgi:hypothetical protein